MTEEDWASQGARLTAEAFKTTTQFLPASQYEIRLVHDDRDNYPIITRHFTRNQLLKSVGYLRGKNREGYHVYFRPEAFHFVFVDDVCEDDIDAMVATGIRPVLVYQTSKGLHHAWVQLANRPEQVTEEEATAAQKILAERFSGDRDATGKNQPGRLPGLRNVKPEYEDANGGYPLVIIKRSCFAPIASNLLSEARDRVRNSPPSSPSAPGGRVLNNSANHIDDNTPLEIYDHGRHVVTMSAKYEVGDIETAFARVLDEMKADGYVVPVKSSGNGTDRSRQDMAIVGYLDRRCVQIKIIEAVLEQGSEKAIERGSNYVEETINAVLNQR
jgi:hypothetical protein